MEELERAHDMRRAAGLDPACARAVEAGRTRMARWGGTLAIRDPAPA